MADDWHIVDNSWIGDVSSASRGIMVTVCNFTSSVKFSRVDYGLTSGVWKHFPNETIEAKTECEFGLCANALFTGAGGFVRYTAVGLNEEEDITFNFSNPYIGTEMASYQSNLGNQLSNFKVTMAATMKSNGINGYLYSIRIEISLTKTITGMRQTLDLEKSSLEHKQSRSYAWKNKLKEGHRSVLITIHNKIEKALVRRDYKLPSGTWAHLPAEQIPPQSDTSFGTISTGILSSTEGFVVYEIMGESGQNFKFSWSNSLLGLPEFRGIAPADRHVDLVSRGQPHCVAEFCVVNKKRSSILPDKKLSDSNFFAASRPKSTRGSDFVTSKNNQLNVLTLSAELFPPIISKDVEARTEKLTEWLNGLKVDVVCLQDVSFEKARIQISVLCKSVFPYIIARQEHFGLMVLSRFPIVWFDFRSFSVVGASQFRSEKGILVAKIEIFSDEQKVKHAYVFNVGLQSDPEETAWRNISNKHNQALQARSDQIESLVSYICGTLSVEPSLPDSAVIIAASLNFPAESDRILLVPEQIEAGFVVPFSRCLNEDVWTPVYSWNISFYLKTHEIHSSALKDLFSRTENPRLRMLLMVEMISASLVGKSVLREHLRTKLERYSSEKTPFDEEAEHNAYLLEHLNHVISNHEKFWTVSIKIALKKRFPNILTAKEEQNNYDLRRSGISIFQLFQSIKWRRNIVITSGTEARLFDQLSKQIPAQLLREDVKSFNYAPSNQNSKNSIKKDLWQFMGRKLTDLNHPTPPYVEMMNQLRSASGLWACDVFRLKNPDSGFTHQERRSDLILTLSSFDSKPLLSLEPQSSSVVSTSLSKTASLSSHQALDAYFSFK